MSRLAELSARHASWQQVIERDLQPHYDAADVIGKIWIESVICVILAQTRGLK